MFVPALRIAISKATSPDDVRALEAAFAKAETLAAVEAGWEAKINASKAARGEKPTKLSKAKREQLSELAADQVEMEKEQMACFEAMSSPREIVRALATGSRSDVKFWTDAAKYMHPGDKTVYEEFVGAKREMLAALDAFLKGTPSAPSVEKSGASERSPGRRGD